MSIIAANTARRRYAFITLDAGRTDASGTNPASDAVTPQMSVAFDDFGRQLRETDPLGKSRTFEYDLYSNVTQTTDAKGQIIASTYGYGGVLTRQSAARSTSDPAPQVTTYTRNPLGQLTQVQSPAVTYTTTYDTAHRVKTLTDSRGGKTLTYTTTPGGRLKRLQDSDGRRTDYLYDPVARLTGIWAANNDLITFIRDRGGRLTEKWLPTGVNTRYTYNDDNTLQRLANRTYGGSVISHNAYTYDAVGNRNTATEQAGSVTTPVMSQAYGYDPLGNRTYKSEGSATFYYLHDSANQLKEVRLNTPTGPLSGALIYDANGNLLQKCEGGTVTATPTACTGTTVTTLAYDVYQRLTQVQKTGIATQSYQYDNQGRRISKTIGSATTHYLYNGDNVHAEYSAWSSAAASYTHGPGTDDPLIRTTPTTHQYYHKDGLGSIVAMTDSTSATTGTQLYDAWGNKLTATASGSIAQYGYTGREPDETGLIYYRARYYDPSVGRFTQRDPIGMKGGMNLYAYAANNPTNRVDPTGNYPMYPEYDPWSVTSYHSGGSLPQPSAPSGIWGDYGAASLGLFVAPFPSVIGPAFAGNVYLNPGSNNPIVSLGVGISTPQIAVNPTLSTLPPSLGWDWTLQAQSPSFFGMTGYLEASWNSQSGFGGDGGISAGRVSTNRGASLMGQYTWEADPNGYVMRDLIPIFNGIRDTFNGNNFGFFSPVQDRSGPPPGINRPVQTNWGPQ